MPKHLSLATVIEKSKIASPHPFLMLLEVDVIEQTSGSFVETLYYVRNNEDITYQGQVYKQGMFDFRITQAAEEIPEVTLSIQDLTGSVIPLADQYAGGTGWPVRFKFITTANLEQPPEVEELVYVMATKAKDYSVEFTLGATNPLAQRFPRRLQWQDRCSWAYKSEECGYVGALGSCDYSLQGPNGCAAHANAARFGGFPGIRQRQ